MPRIAQGPSRWENRNQGQPMRHASALGANCVSQRTITYIEYTATAKATIALESDFSVVLRHYAC